MKRGEKKNGSFHINAVREGKAELQTNSKQQTAYKQKKVNTISGFRCQSVVLRQTDEKRALGGGYQNLYKFLFPPSPSHLLSIQQPNKQNKKKAVK